MSENTIYNASIEARERAERLRRLRNLANLSRKELCEGADINIHTYIGYEVGRYGGLTEKGAEKIIPYVASMGVFSSFEWLMHGIGKTPQVVTDINVHTDISNIETDYEKEKQIVLEELSLFKKHYQSSLDYEITDDGMLPAYALGDYVAGVCFSGKRINEYIGSDCIVQLANGDFLLRNLRAGRADGIFTLVCNNPNTTVEQPIIYNIELLFAAKILWHRRFFSKN